MSFNAKRSTFQVLGCIIKKPDLVDEVNYMIKDERSKKQILEDLFPEVFHRLIFSVVNNLYCEQNVRTIDYIAVDNFLSQYPTQYEVYKNNNGNEYVVEAISNCNLENFEYNLERLKKFALLRAYERIGVDTTEIYNENIVSPKKKEEMQEQFENMKLQDIVNEIEKKAVRIKDAFLSGVDNSSIHASEGMFELKERLKKTPEIGNSLSSGIMNTISRGARLKKLYLRSASSGYGKCVVGNTLINTDKGLLRIDEIPEYYEVGKNGESISNIISYDLETGEQKILPTSHWYNMGKSETIKIVTSYGYEIEGTPEHPIVVGDERGNIFFKKLKDITKEDKVIISMNNELFGKNETSIEQFAFIDLEQVPREVLTGTKEVVSRFLQQVFCGYSEIYTKHGTFARQVQVLLLSFGIISNRQMIEIDGEGFFSVSMEINNKKENMFFDSIKSIEQGEQVVYDFTVPITHNFVANGTISHNTRLSLGDSCMLGTDEIWDIRKKEWVYNGVAEKVLFITTELEEEEVQTPMMACVSGVDEEKIKDGKYTPEEEARVDKAIEVLQRSNIFIDYIPNFDAEEIERTIQRHILENGVKYVFFD